MAGWFLSKWLLDFRSASKSRPFATQPLFDHSKYCLDFKSLLYFVSKYFLKRKGGIIVLWKSTIVCVGLSLLDLFPEKLAYLQVVTNYRYSVVQMCTGEECSPNQIDPAFFDVKVNSQHYYSAIIQIFLSSLDPTSNVELITKFGPEQDVIDACNIISNRYFIFRNPKSDFVSPNIFWNARSFWEGLIVPTRFKLWKLIL